MNVSMQDGFNIAWKLGHVLEGRSPESLLSTYSAERQVVAKNLIDFDKEWSTMMAKKPEEFDDPSDLEDFYVRTAEFPAGFMTEYAPSMLVAPRSTRTWPRASRGQALQISARGAGGRHQPHAPRPPRHSGRAVADLRLRGRGAAGTHSPVADFASGCKLAGLAAGGHAVGR
jgi:phenol 2-monooxygenase